MSARFIKAAAIYFFIGTALGLTIGILEKFEFTSVHAHINLVGWASLGIVGLIYKAYPEAGKTQLATVQYWLHMIGLPLLIISMIIFTTDNHAIGIPIASVGGLMVIASALLLTINVFKRIK
ncbi:cytochrome-c oxidase [Paenibacillus sp. CMAA1364]